MKLLASRASIEPLISLTCQQRSSSPRCKRFCCDWLTAESVKQALAVSPDGSTSESLSPAR